MNLILQDHVFHGYGVASATVARLFKGGVFLFADHETLASESAGYRNFRLPPMIAIQANEF